MALADPPPNAAGHPWPRLDPAALHGLAGEIVQALEPHTEADPVAVLVTVLATFGAMAGPGVGERPHAMADSAIHPGRIFPLLVGDTANARKGTSWQNVRRVYYRANPTFLQSRVMSGFGSGEALIAELARQDEITYGSSAEAGDGTSAEDALCLPDKRILLIEPEFARLLVVGSWQGSTISPIIRQAYDGDPLELRVRRQKPLIAHDSHVVVIGHITMEELKARITTTDMYSGFVNRFQIFCVRRSKLLPSGGDLDEAVVDRLARDINRRLRAVHDLGLIGRSELAEKKWACIYHQMAEEDAAGMLGAAVARAPVQMLRNSLIYALMDGCATIKTQHVKAAFALWSYARESMAYIFGSATGSEVADIMLSALKSAGRTGLSRTEISAVLGRHRSAKEIDVAEGLLRKRGLIEDVPPRKGPGRPERRIRFVEQ